MASTSKPMNAARQRGSGPSEKSPQRILDIPVLSRCRRRDHGRKPQHDRGAEQEDGVDSASVPPPRLGRREQGKRPRTGQLTKRTSGIASPLMRAVSSIGTAPSRAGPGHTG
jgi:hypothetical protein